MGSPIFSPFSLVCKIPKRSKSPLENSPSYAGGLPLPSLKWQPEQFLALKKGPRPSLAVVDAGAVTQLWLKSELPTPKVTRSSNVRSGEAKPKASAEKLLDDVVPPESSSPSSAINGTITSSVLHELTTTPSKHKNAIEILFILYNDKTGFKKSSFNLPFTYIGLQNTIL